MLLEAFSMRKGPITESDLNYFGHLTLHILFGPNNVQQLVFGCISFGFGVLLIMIIIVNIEIGRENK